MYLENNRRRNSRRKHAEALGVFAAAANKRSLSQKEKESSRAGKSVSPFHATM
jgi:hypothetical protein